MFGVKLEVKLRPIQGLGSLKAYADLRVNNTFEFRNLKVVEGKNGTFVSFPSEKSKKNENYYEQVRVLDRDLLKQINEAIIGAYKSAPSKN